jgi:NHLM bacteriocin system ABC transporter peptidase/ATP-binding protein
MEASECGAAALAMVLDFHGSYIPLERLRVECGVSRDGSKASNIVKAARRFGMEAKGFRKSPDDLRHLPMPAIIHWNFNHFLVLEGFGKKGKVYLNDPGQGPREITEEELDQAFTGVVLTFEPVEDFTPGGSRPSMIPSLLARLKGSEDGLAFVLLASILLVVPGLIIPIFGKVFVDDILIAQKTSWLKPLLLGMAATAIARGVLTWMKERYLLRLSMKLSISMSGQFLWHVLRLPVGFFSARFPGDLATRVQINDRLAHMISGRLAATILDLILVVFYGILMLAFDPVLTGIVVFFASLNILALRFVSRKRVDLSLRVQQERGKLMGVAMSGLQMIESLKASGAEDDFFAKWSGYHAKSLNADQRLAVTSLIVGAVPGMLSTLNTAAILGIGALRVMDGELTMGMLVAFQSLMGSFMGPITGLVSFADQLQIFQGDLSRLDDVLGNEQDSQIQGDHEGTLERSRLDGSLTIAGLRFGYSPLAPPLVDGFDLHLDPARRVALVGGSGSGKSTIAKLVGGLLIPWEGDILFDGETRSEVPRALLTSSVAMVDQDIFLFEGTVRENLTMWDDTVSEAEIVQAAKDACIHDDITALPGGYDAQIQEGGRNFSGGQRQRLEIARALCSNPSLVILDEATSALDSETEKRVDANLRRRGCTCLIVAHRLSTIRDADEIIVLNRGKVVERGSHDQLKDTGGHYADLVLAG